MDEWDEIAACTKAIKAETLDEESKYSTEYGKEYHDHNRYIDIMPFEWSRVKLKNSDYINASWIDNKRFIATQGPLEPTIRTFWEMIIEYKVKMIVMLCKLDELDTSRPPKNPGDLPNMRSKCARYWPHVLNESMFIGR